MRLKPDHILLLIDLTGTAFFAMEGAVTAMRSQLDLLGILVVSFVTALGGGIVRDVLIGDIPPASMRDWRYLAVAFVAGGATFLLSGSHLSLGGFWLTAIDAAGLSFFAVAGAAKAAEARLNPLLSVMLGGITGVGGGTVRDLLLNRVPAVLRTDIYASAALLGAATLVILLALRMPSRWATAAGILGCFALRMTAYLRHWNLPHA